MVLDPPAPPGVISEKKNQLCSEGRNTEDFPFQFVKLSFHFHLQGSFQQAAHFHPDLRI